MRKNYLKWLAKILENKHDDLKVGIIFYLTVYESGLRNEKSSVSILFMYDVL